jgi:hypothetical protein
MLKKWIIPALALMAAALTGCELAQIPQATPTVEVPVTDTATIAPSLPPSPSPSPTLTPQPQIENTVTETPGPPTEPPTQTFTPNPYATHIIQSQDTLYYILQQPPFFYRELPNDAMVALILTLNPNMRSIDRLPGPGNSILLPLPTATTTPEGFALTQTAQPGGVPDISLPGNWRIVQVQVQEGDTIVGIAQRNSTTLPIVATLNPQLFFSGCDFRNPSGGPDCNVSLTIGDSINVPELTPTPTLSPTISGSETATLTPTFSAPTLIFPPQDANAAARTFQLQWISAGVLQGDERYLVEIEDLTSGARHLDVTTTTSYELPESLVPTDGQTHDIQWRVSVAAPNPQGQYRYIGAQGEWRTFHWQSR